MKDRFEAFLATAENKQTRDIAELKELFLIAGGAKSDCSSDTCINKMLTLVKKYYHLNFVEPTPVSRKYLLKDGNHCFAPGGPAEHNNDNTSDEDIESLLKIYPHIKDMLIN